MNKEYQKQYREKNKEKYKEYQKQYREKNKEKSKEYQKEYHKGYTKKKEYQKDYLKTPQGTKVNRIGVWKHRGVVSDDWDSLYETYINCESCEECKGEFTDKNIKCLDHNHETGEFRNILCLSCNIKRR